jgi:hypothetical protein
MQSRKSFLLRLSPALYEQLEAWARQEMRSVNGQIEFLLKEAVRRRGRAVAMEGDEPPRPENPAASAGPRP